MSRVVSIEQPSTIKNCGSDVCVFDQCARDLRDEHAGHAADRSMDLATSALMSLKRVEAGAVSEKLPPKKRKREDDRRPAPRNDLVQRCAEFTTALKATHPPGSPVFALFQKFVCAQRCSSGIHDHKRIILELIDLLKPTPRLLKLFCNLLPKWCFTSYQETSSSASSSSSGALKKANIALTA